MMSRTRALATAAVSLLLAATTTACGGEDKKSTADPSQPPTMSTPTATPTPTWDESYSTAQIAEYNAALGRFTEYESRAEPVWATGKVTPSARKLFKEYWVDWPKQVDRLQLYAAGGISDHGLARVLWSKPVKVTLRDSIGFADVTFNQCIDPSTVTEQPSGTGGRTQPYVRTVELSKTGTTAYLIDRLVDITNSKKVAPCGA